MIQLPLAASGKWSVKHGQDFMADIVNTRNMDFNRSNFATLSKKPVVLYTEDTDTDFGTVMAILPVSSGSSTVYYIITTENAFSWDANVFALTQLSTTSQPTMGFDSDAVYFNSCVYVSGDSTIKYWNGSWNAGVSGLGTDYPHPLCALDFQPYLAAGYFNTVKTYDTGHSVVATCTLPTDFIVTGLRSRNGNVYIATRALGGQNAKLFLWNGSGTTPQYAYDVGSDWIYSMSEFQSSVVVLTSAGQLLRFNGGGFDEIAHFPVYETPYSWTTDSSLDNVIGKCANRGMITQGDILYINIDGSLNVSGNEQKSFLVTQPSGLWVFDPAVGLYHKGGYLYTKYNSTAFTFGSSILTFASAHNLQTGDPVLPTDVTGLTGISESRLYFAIYDSSTTIMLANTKADALAGNNITITGAPSGATVILDTFESIGAVETARVGAVGLFITDNPPSILGGEIMYAGDVLKTNGSTSVSALMSFGAGHNIGSFTTTPLPASQVTDTFQKLVQYIKNLYLDDEKITVKYRTTSTFGLPTQVRHSTDGFAVWVTDSQFTIDGTAKDFSAVSVGDEVDIIDGAGAGYTAHISAISNVTTTYTVDIDENIPGITVGMKSEVIVDNWRKLSDITNVTENIEQEFAQLLLGETNSLIQFKVELRGFGVSVRKLQSISAASKLVA